MSKSLLIYICLLFMIVSVTSCTGPVNNDNIELNANKQTAEKITQTSVNDGVNVESNNLMKEGKEMTKTVCEYFSMSKDEIIQQLGDSYEIVATGAEGSFEGYNYIDKGLMFVFETDGSLLFINCNENFEVNGAKSGMNFDQIKEKLGNVPIEETWYESTKNISYKVTYDIDNCLYRFLSFQKDGTDSKLTILRKAP